MFTSTIRSIRISHQNEKFEIFNLEIYLKVSLIKSTDNSDFFCLLKICKFLTSAIVQYYLRLFELEKNQIGFSGKIKFTN